LMRKPVIFWSHAWPRAGMHARTRSLRLLMWRLADVKTVYTVRQMFELRQAVTGDIFPACNAIYSKKLLCRRQRMMRNRFVYVGRLVEDKKVALLIDACGILTRQGIECGLDVVGAGPELERLRSLVDSLGIADNV